MLAQQAGRRLKRRRLFFALWPDDAVRQALFHWQTHNLPGTVRWQHRADLHMTLHFLGMVETERVGALVDVGDGAAGNSCTLVLDSIGHFPKAGVLWAGPTSVPAALNGLHERLGEGLRDADFETEARRYRPHVTLARKVGRAEAFGPLAPLTWTATEMALVESRTGEVPMYHALHRWRLA